jgi:4-amino-4-deoxy-L-arabinose transferase-like glycosyltransferase
MNNFVLRLRIIPRIILVAFTLIVVLAVVLYIGVYAYVALVRMPYPYELEWIESGFVGQVGRILTGQPVYGPPDIAFTPFLYTPLFFYLAAAAAKITGAGFLPLRLVSFLSSLVAMGGMFAVVFRRKRNAVAALLAAGLLAASYRITGAWLDVGRVDSLAVALLVLFCLALPSSPDRFRFLISGLLAALMVLAKQSMLVAVLPFFLVHLLEFRRRALWMAAGFLAPLGLVTLWLNLTSGGWYSFYTFDLLFQQTEWLGQEVIVAFWKTDLLRHYFPSIGFAAAGLFLLFRRERSEFWKWLSLLAGAVLCSFLARIKAGGYDNVLLPSIAVLGILLGIGWDRLTEKLVRDPNTVRDGVGILLAVAALYQFYHLRYSPADQLPTERDYRAGEAFVQYLSDLPGEVYVPYHTQYAVMAGKQPYAHQAALWDVLRGESSNRGKEILAGRIEQAVRERRFDSIILDGAGQWNFLYGLEDYYSLQTEAIPPDGAPAPLTGWRISPQSVFLPMDNHRACIIPAADVRLQRVFPIIAKIPMWIFTECHTCSTSSGTVYKKQ